MEFKHVSVLLDECIEGLAVKPDGIYVDGTLGGAGHAFHVCERLSEKGQFIGIDQDEAAIRTSTERLQPFGNRVHLVRSNYVNVKQVVKELQIDKVDGILLDLGVYAYGSEPGFYGERSYKHLSGGKIIRDHKTLWGRAVCKKYREKYL